MCNSLIIGGLTGALTAIRAINYLSDFAESWLKGVYMCQDATCEIISESDHPLNSYDQKSKCAIMPITGGGLLGSV